MNSLVLIAEPGLLGSLAATAGRLGLSAGALASDGDPVRALREASGADVIALAPDRPLDGAALLAAVREVSQAGSRIVLLPSPGADLTLWRAWLEPAGGVVASGLREFCDIACHLAITPDRAPPAGAGVAIVTGGGGTGVIVADLCAAGGLEVPTLSDATRAAMAPLLPPIASTANPVDTTPQVHAEQWAGNYGDVLDLIAADPAVDAVMFPVAALTGSYGDRAEAVVAFRHRSAAHVLLAVELLDPDESADLARRGIYNFEDPARAVAAFATLRRAAMARRCDPSGAILPVADPAAAGLPAPLSQSSDPDMALHCGLGGLPLQFRAWDDAEFGRCVSVAAGGRFGPLLPDVAILPPCSGPDAAARALDGLRLVTAWQKVDRRYDAATAARALSEFAALAAGLDAAALPVVLDPVTARDGTVRVGVMQGGRPPPGGAS